MVFLSFYYNIYVIMFIIMCASNTWYDKYLFCLYPIMSLYSVISYHISIISWPSNILHFMHENNNTSLARCIKYIAFGLWFKICLARGKGRKCSSNDFVEILIMQQRVVFLMLKRDEAPNVWFPLNV